ncbi:hypothetical protein EDD17DRAFT_1514867 [Pisolithus thermaeus]|nr:hypothetical protein EDD17DRAFT_1514867 [Pisolithus thermaeus]
MENWLLADQNIICHDAYKVHGTKGASIHKLDDLPGAQSALNEMLDHLDLHTINDENWFIDFTDGQKLPLQNILNQSSHQAVANLMKSKKFKTDHMVLLKDCAGFRAEMMIVTSSVTPSYFIKKNVHYQRHPSLYQYCHADELQIPEKHKKVIGNLDTMSKTLVECSDTQRTLQIGSAYLEVRVPLCQAIMANSQDLVFRWSYKASWMYRACCQKVLANPDNDAEDPDAKCEVDEEVLLLVYNWGNMLDIQSAFGMDVI